MEDAASQTKNKNGFDGNIGEKNSKQLVEFCNVNQVPPISQALAEVLTFMEMCNEKKIPEIKETAMYNSLLRLEKAVANTSSWELFGQDYDGPDLNLTNFEINMLEQQFSVYIISLLGENTPEALFFPLSDFYSSDIIVKWRVLEKIAEIKLLAQGTIYKEKLKLHLKERLKNEISRWLNKELEKLKLSSETVRKDIENLNKTLKSLQSEVNMAMDVTLSESLFKEAQCNYSEVLSETVDDIIFPICERVMEMMDSYQDLHREFHVNMRDSCALSHGLYLQLKKLYTVLTTHDKIERHLKLEDYRGLFSKFFVNLLQVIKLECHNRIKRAVQIECKDDIHSEEQILSSSVIVLNCICTVIDEWKHLEIDDDEQKIAFIVKITDILCDGVSIFAESLECRLLSMNAPVKDLESLKKIFILANSVEHVLQYLQELPQQMLWLEVLEEIDESPDKSLKEQVLRILKLIHGSMNTHASDIISRMLSVAVNGIYNITEKTFLMWLQSQTTTSQAFERFLAHLNEVLEFSGDTLKDKLFPQLLSRLLSFLIPLIERHFQEGQYSDYARTVKDNVGSLCNYLQRFNMDISDVRKPLLQNLQVAETLVSPVEYLGHIAFQAGFKSAGDDLVDLYINIQKGQKLPARKFEMTQLTVKVELCPNTLFPSHVPLKALAANEDIDNPVFNECFQFSDVPLSVLDVKGAAVQILVYNQDYSYSAESILLLNKVQNMSGVASLEFLPVYLMQLRKFDMSHITYQVLENRSKWDKNAKIFINKRAKLSKNQKKFLPCIPGKNIMCGFSGNG